MKIRVDFTLDIPPEAVANLVILSGGDISVTPDEMRNFVRSDVEDYIIHYLTSNGVDAKIVRRLL